MLGERTTKARAAIAAALVLAAGVVVAVAPIAPGIAAAAGPVPDGASSFTPAAPHRVLDTRTGLGATGPLAANAVVVLSRDALGVPSGASAVAVNVTLTEAAAAGYATLWPAGQDRPLASNVNVAAGGTVANFAIVPLSAQGLALAASTSTHALLDVSGWTVTTSSSVAAGRIVTTPQVRVLDTRSDGGPLGPGGRTLSLAVAGVPADATAAVLNVTATDNVAAGYVAAWPAGQPQPGTSSVNTSAPGQTVANLVVVPLGTGGAVQLAASSSVQVVVDVLAYLSGPSALPDVAGLYVPVAPARVADSRALALLGAAGPFQPGHRVDVAIGGKGGVPADGVGAAFLNVTVVDSTGAGFLATYPAGVAWPGTSSVNLDQPGQTRANLVLAGLGAQGHVSLYASTRHDVVVDVAGYVLGSLVPGQPGVPATAPATGWWACAPGEVPAPPPVIDAPAGSHDGNLLSVTADRRFSTYTVPGSEAATMAGMPTLLRAHGLDPLVRNVTVLGLGSGTRVGTGYIGMGTGLGQETQVVVEAMSCGVVPQAT